MLGICIFYSGAFPLMTKVTSIHAPNYEGYLLADTTTPDGYYVNKHGVLEIGGREVAHSEECLYVTTSINVPDKNHVDPNQYRY